MKVVELERLCDLLGCNTDAFLEGRPIRYGFRMEQVAEEDHEAIRDINRIVKNLVDMRKWINGALV